MHRIFNLLNMIECFVHELTYLFFCDVTCQNILFKIKLLARKKSKNDFSVTYPCENIDTSHVELLFYKLRKSSFLTKSQLCFYGFKPQLNVECDFNILFQVNLQVGKCLILTRYSKCIFRI